MNPGPEPPNAPAPGDPRPPLTFRPRHRLTHAREFEAVYGSKVRKSRGPLVVFTRPNGLGNHRLGLAVGARVGGAVVRSRLKRLVREAFRLEQHDLTPAGDGSRAPAAGFDIIVSVRPTDGLRALPLSAVRQLLRDLVAEAASEWARRERRDANRFAAPPSPEAGA